MDEYVDRIVRQGAQEVCFPIAAETVRRGRVEHLLHGDIRHPGDEVGYRRPESAQRFQQALTFVQIVAALGWHDRNRRIPSGVVIAPA